MRIIRKTLKNDEKFLRQISKEVDLNDRKLKKDIQALDKYCKETVCFALASVQIGIPKRIIYLKNTTESIDIENKEYNESRILINPVIISRKGLAEFWEACLSCGNYMGLVDRPYEIEVEYYDTKGIKHNEVFKGFESTVLSHEYDHLDGILHIDVAKELVEMPLEERKEFRKTRPYKIISKDCDYEKNAKLKRKLK